MADFDIKISERDSWNQVVTEQKKVPSPKESPSVDIYLPYGYTNGMVAFCKHFTWNKGNFFILKPNQTFGTIDEWGPTFGFKFKLYVSQLPKKPGKVSVKYRDMET